MDGERWIDRLLREERSFFGVTLKCADVMFMLCIAMLAFYARRALFPIITGDFKYCLAPWMADLRDIGRVRDSCNYPAAYLCLMKFLTYISHNTESDLIALKMLSVFFDYVSAAASFMIVLKITSNVQRSALAAALMLFSPGVVMDGAYWGQCDIIYCSFLLWAFYFLLKDRGAMCGVMFGLAISFKLQAVFMLPFFVIMWLKNRTIKFRHSFIIPAVFLLSVVIGWAMGVRDFQDLLMIYARQTGNYSQGSLNYPNIYVLIGEGYREAHHTAEAVKAGIYVTAALLGMLAYYTISRRFRLTHDILFALGTLSIAISVYMLPHMHERYGLMLDVLTAVWACTNIRRLTVFCCASLVSLSCFMPFLIGRSVISMEYTAVFLGAVIVYLAMELHTAASAESYSRSEHSCSAISTCTPLPCTSAPFSTEHSIGDAAVSRLSIFE